MHYEYEVIKHDEGLPLKVFCVSVGSRLYHWHEHIEVLFILKGSIMLQLRESEHILKEQDIFLINSNEVHSLKQTEEENVLLTLQINVSSSKIQYKDLRNLKFNDQLLSSRDDIAFMIRYLLASIMLTMINKKENKFFIAVGFLNLFLGYLLDNYAYEVKKDSNDKIEYADLKRLKRITKFVNENYMRKISLQEIADNEHLSKYYVSHFIKDKLGMGFQEFLNKVRLEKSLILLRNTDLSVLDISIACGFSDIRYLNKLVRVEYGCTAKEFKKRYKNNDFRSYQISGDESRHLPFDFQEAINRLKEYAKEIWNV